VPRVSDLAALSAYVERCDDEDLLRVIEKHRATIGTEFAAEAPFLQALPAEPFSTARPLSARVDAKSRVCVRQCRYSVPTSLIGRRVQVGLDAEEVTLSFGGRVVARCCSATPARGSRTCSSAQEWPLVRPAGVSATSPPPRW
jgi:hypothetical protein